MKMKNSDNTWTDDAKELVWRKAPIFSPLNDIDIRLDPCGAIIKWNEYGNRDSIFGWEIDHTIPETILDEYKVPKELIDDPINLRPMQWSNNVQKKKGFPIYKATDIRIGNFNYHKQYLFKINWQQIENVRLRYSQFLNIIHPTTVGKWFACRNKTFIDSPTFFDDRIQ